jgi:hypothetical protein
VPTISVDLAYRNYRDIGVAVLKSECEGIEVDFVTVPLPGDPEPSRLAEFLVELCTTHRAEFLLLDGPQAWKDSSNGLVHSRVCERALNTPAKTGLPGSVKPSNYLPFVSFSISVFDELAARGWPRLGKPDHSERPVAVESFPFSAWRSIGARPLPAKARSGPSTLTDQLTALRQRYPLQIIAGQIMTNCKRRLLDWQA